MTSAKNKLPLGAGLVSVGIVATRSLMFGSLIGLGFTSLLGSFLPKTLNIES